MKIQILGAGCAACKKVLENAEKAIEGKKGNFEIEKVTDMAQIAAMGVMQTPAVAIDGVVKSKGRVISSEEIAELIK